MKIKIYEHNIGDYLNDKFFNVTKVKWRSGELNRSVIDNFPNLKNIDCANNNLTTLEPLSNCINLQKIICYNNKLTTLEPLRNCIKLNILICCCNDLESLEPISNCLDIAMLFCRHNKITSLDSLSDIVNILIIDCSYNKITTMNFLSKMSQLHILNCRNNQLTSIKAITKCVRLTELNCKNNQLDNLDYLINCVRLKSLGCSNNNLKLDFLTKCINLKKLTCNNNHLTTLEFISNCINLEDLDCRNNQIISLAPVVYLRRLKKIKYDNNPLEIQTMQVQRFLNQIQNNMITSIYNDRQNVHDPNIQRTVCDSLQSLLLDPKPNFSIDDIINSNVNNETKQALIEYYQDQTIHSIHLISYGELLSYVWNRIIKSEYQTELNKILEEQISDAECKCFTGRFNRTLSVLVGFYDDIKINISDNSRISTIILNCKYKIIPYNNKTHQEISEKELIDAGYNKKEIEPWISAIDEIELTQ